MSALYSLMDKGTGGVIAGMLALSSKGWVTPPLRRRALRLWCLRMGVALVCGDVMRAVYFGGVTCTN